MCVRHNNNCIILIVVSHVVILFCVFLLFLRTNAHRNGRCVLQFQYTFCIEWFAGYIYSAVVCYFVCLLLFLVCCVTFLSYRLSGLLMSNRTMLKGKSFHATAFRNILVIFVHNVFVFSLFRFNGCNVYYVLVIAMLYNIQIYSYTCEFTTV